MNPKKSKAKQRAIPKQGMYPARCIVIADMGTQPSLNPKYPAKEKIMFIFELIGTKHVFDEDKGPQPFVLKETFTNTSHKDGNIRKMFTNWAGQSFTDEEFESIDFFSYAYKSCMIQVIHNTDKKDPSIKYANIGLVTPVPDGTKVGPAVNDIIAFEIGGTCKIKKAGSKEGKIIKWTEAYEELYPWLQDKIAESPEFKEAAKRDKYKRPNNSINEDIQEEELDENEFPGASLNEDDEAF